VVKSCRKKQQAGVTAVSQLKDVAAGWLHLGIEDRTVSSVDHVRRKGRPGDARNCPVAVDRQYSGTRHDEDSAAMIGRQPANAIASREVDWYSNPLPTIAAAKQLFPASDPQFVAFVISGVSHSAPQVPVRSGN
jgi:hypothetical protein